MTTPVSLKDEANILFDRYKRDFVYICPDVTTWECVLLRIVPKRQKGPTCGIAALSMAAAYFGIKGKDSTGIPSPNSNSSASFDNDCELLLHAALEMGLTRFGEMWPLDIVDVAGHHYSLKASIHDCNLGKEIAQLLLDGIPVLLPYDADANHGPCQKNGLKAHWGLLKGLIYPCDSGTTNSLPASPKEPRLTKLIEYNYPLDDSEARKHHATSKPVIGNLDLRRAFVVVQQGKSAHAGVWRLMDMLESCKQLTEVEVEQPGEKFTPRDDPEKLKSALAGQFVVLHGQ